MGGGVLSKLDAPTMSHSYCRSLRLMPLSIYLSPLNTLLVHLQGDPGTVHMEFWTIKEQEYTDSW